MNISNGINQYNNFSNSSVTSNSSTQSLTGNTISELKEGQVFEGAVNSIDANGKVTIGLANGQNLFARLDSGVNLNIGKTLFFQVKSNDGSLIQIKPVSYDISGNATLLNALESASIIPSQKSLEMVDMMMNQSMPISSDALNEMNRLILSNPDIDPKTVVLMNKYSIPISSSNAAMFENYQQNTVNLNNDLMKLSNSIPKLLASTNISAEQAVDIQNKINTILSLDENADIIPDDLLKTNEVKSQNISVNSNIIESVEISDLVQKNEQVLENQSNSQNIVGNVVTTYNEEMPIRNGEINQVASETMDMSVFEKSDLTKDLDININPKDVKIFEEFPEVKEYAIKSGLLSADKEISSKDVFNIITKFSLDNVANREILDKIFSSNSYQKTLKNVLQEAFSISPEEITDAKALKHFYKKILAQTQLLEKAFSDVSEKLTETIKSSTSNIKENVSFMNTSNELYSYLQIPLKMYNQNTDGTLYVRQNKKNAYEQGELITAFLHFDMKYLGSTDVFVSLQEKNVSCKWTLADEKSLKLIEDNIDLLNEKLRSKGYNCSMEYVNENKAVDFVKDFLAGSDLNTVTTKENIVHRYSFDMRA